MIITSTVTDRTMTVVCRGEIDYAEWRAELAKHGLSRNQMCDDVDYTADINELGEVIQHFRLHFAVDDTTVR